MAVIGIIALVLLLIVAALAVLWMQRRRRSNALREQFGPEYDRAVAEAGGRRQAEADLDQRRRRVEELQIVELSPEESDAFTRQWNQVQLRFVDRPAEAIGEADQLVARVMERRGYPVSDFDRRAADISVDHPEVVSAYRDARAVAVKNADGGASTEELRQALLHYRALVGELLGKTAGA
ncbi:MAG: hypothetical protein U0446_02805 [Dehalococcoidia bacterium]